MKSFATSICPIKKSSRSEYEASPRHPRAIPAPYHHHPRAIPPPSPRHPRAILAPSPRGETITQPISKRFLSGVITGLRHGDLAYRYSSAIPTCRTIQLSLSNRPLTGPRPVFATATLLTGTSVPSPRGEPSPNRSQNGFFPVS